MGGELREVGRVGGLGKGEQIYAVRFIGHVSYVVTFRQVDPLYTVDLSDPTNPRVRGELKILGYSAYLHPVGDGVLLGVGQDASGQGRIRGTQISLFDISGLDVRPGRTPRGLGKIPTPTSSTTITRSCGGRRAASRCCPCLGTASTRGPARPGRRRQSAQR